MLKINKEADKPKLFLITLLVLDSEVLSLLRMEWWNSYSVNSGVVRDLILLLGVQLA